ncbi:MAG: hypothetical protein O2916_09305 [Proteobacteria bacterium]|nr:hypothetical protein [Pseudomonadota bacterium]
MARKQKMKQPFDRKDGILVFPISVIKSKNYQTMYPYSRILMMFLQVHWRAYKPVDFSTREAAELLNCNHKTAMRAFNVLEKRGFIVKVAESIFNNRTQSKSRSWRLTWLPFEDMQPTKEWQQWTE